MWNLLLAVKGLRDNPSVKPAACQLSTRHALRVPFQGSLKKASLEKGGGSPLGGGGVLVESFACCKRDYEITPQSACGCQLSPRHALRVPFQGSLNKEPPL